MPALRLTPIPSGTGTPAAAYAREQRMLAAYQRQLYSIHTDTEQLIRDTLGEKKTSKQVAAAEQRLDYDVPELLSKVRWDQQEPLEQLLLREDLVGFIRAVLIKERSLLQREESRPMPDDRGHAKAAGLGRISSENYGRSHPGYLFRLPEPKPKKKPLPMLRAKRRKRWAYLPYHAGQLGLFC